MRRRSLPLRTLLLGLVCIPLAALVVNTLHGVYRQFASASEEALRIAQRVADRTAIQTADLLASSQHILGELAQRPAVRAMDPSNCDPLLADVRRLQPRYANVLTLDLTGRLVCTVTPLPAGATGAPDPKYYFDEVLRTRRFTAGRPAQGFVTGRWVSTLAYPVVDDAGKLLGVVGLPLDLVNYQRVVSTPAPPPGAIVAILNGDGILIAHSSSELASQIGTVRHDEAARAIVERRSGTARLTGFDDTERFFAFSPIPHSDWIAVAGLDVAQELAPATQDALKSLLLILVVNGVAVALTLLLRRRIAQPLEAMAKTVAAVRDGDYSRRTRPAGADELVEIGNQLNAMLETRERMEAELRRSGERYRALAESSPDAIYIHQDMRIAFVNGAMLALMRARAAADLVGRPVLSVVPPELAEPAGAQMAALYAGRAQPRAEQVYVRLDGSPVDVEIAAAPMVLDGRPAAQVTVRDITERSRERSLLVGQARCMETIAAGTALPDTLHAIAQFIEADSPEMLASILLLDEDGVHIRHGAAGRLPRAYWQAIDGLPIGPRVGSCGTAMYRGEQVIVEDIERDPLWESYRGLAAQHGLRACWSTPIFDPQRRVLGSFALYFREPKRLCERYLRLIGMATHIAAIAIVRDRTERERVRLLHDLGERVKETTLLHEATRLLGGEGTVSRTLLGDLVALIPSGWQNIGQCVARIAWGQLEAKTPGWRESPWMLTSRFATADGQEGAIEVAYLDLPEGAAGDPFLPEERELIRSLGDMLATHLERNRALAALKISETVFRTTFENAAIGMTLTDPQGRLIKCNPAFARMLGYAPEQLVGRNFSEITHPDDIEPNQRLYRALMAGEIAHFQMQKRYLRQDGEVVWIQLSVSKAPLEGGEQFTVGMMEDITVRRRAEEELRESERRYRGILESMSDGFVALDHELRFTYANPRAAVILDRKIEEMVGRAYLEVFPEAAGSPFELTYRRVLAEGSTVHSEHFFEPWQRWFEQRVDPTPDGISVFFHDATERKRYESRVEYLATHDGLTDLPNRNLIRDRITQALPIARRAGRQLAVLYIDFDRFKVVNDGFGHPFGDQLLKAAGQRLHNMLRDGDTVARLGGDEFVILLADLRRSADVYMVAQKAIEVFAQPFVLEDREILLSASIGVSLFPQDGETADALIGNADVAMFRAKKLGGNTHQFFTQEMSEETHRRVEVETQLRSAIGRGELHLVYQPKVELATGRISGCEALVRWIHPTLGPVSPGHFIPIAEDSGLIVPIGDWVLHTACAQNKAWHDAGLPPVVVSVNLSARQFLQRDIVAWTMKTLRDTGLAPERLELELTESLIAHDVEKVIATINSLKAAGVRLSIDDFGTGYSSLSYLKRFRVHALKIDQSFIRNLDTDAGDATIALAVISLAHNLGLTAIAEGVESDKQCRFLRANGCDAIQGYLFSKPVRAAEFEAMLRSDKRLASGAVAAT